MHEFENNDIVPLSVNPVITDIGNYSKIKHDPVADPVKTRTPDIEPLEKGDPNIEQVLNKIQTQFFGDQSYHNKHRRWSGMCLREFKFSVTTST